MEVATRKKQAAKTSAKKASHKHKKLDEVGKRDEGNLMIEIIPWTGCFPGKVGEGESSGAGRRRTCESNRTVSRPVAMFRTRTAEWPTVLITRNPVRATGSSLSWRLSDVVPSQIVTKSPGANVG